MISSTAKFLFRGCPHLLNLHEGMTKHGFGTPASWLIRADPDGLLPVARPTDRRLHKLVDLVLRPILDLEKKGAQINPP
jgi:hypothetical protein